MKKFKASPAGAKFWGARIIWTVSRGKVRDKIIADMQNALVKKAKYPKLLSGYDLVSQEDLGRPLSDLAPELIWFQRQTESLDLIMAYFFHAGETLGDGNSTDDNLFDAEMFGTRRIDHGFSLFKHPYLMDVYREKDIAVEVCLISNEALRLNGDVLQHPLPAMIAHGVATSLSNDDPAIEGQNDAGLSYDFFEAIQGFDNIGLAGLVSFHYLCSTWLTFNRATWLRILSDSRILSIRTIFLGSLISLLVRMVMGSRLVTYRNGIGSGRTFASE